MLLPAISVRHRRTDWLRGFTLVAVIGFAIPLLAAAVTGNLSIPHSDGWAYSRITETFASTGKIHLLDWNRAALIGQVLLLAPVASSLAAQQAVVALLGLITLAAVYDLMLATLTARRATLATLLIAIWPGWAVLTTSTLSDVPAFAGTFVALAIGRRALHRDVPVQFGAALLIGFWAATVREQAMAAPVSLLLYAWWGGGQRLRVNRRMVALAAVALVAAFAAFFSWRNGLSRGDHPPYLTSLRGDLDAFVIYVAQTYFTLAAVLTPAVLLTAAPWHWRRRSQLAAVVTGLAFIVAASSHEGALASSFFGLEDPTILIDGRSTAFTTTVHHAVLAMALISGMLLAGTLVQRWRRADPLLGVFTIVTALGVALAAAVGQGIIDRYLIGLVPGVMTVVLARTPESDRGPAGNAMCRTRVGLAGCTLAGIACVSAVLAAQTLSTERAIWHAGTGVASAGVPAARVDAGLEWMGWHSPDGVLYRKIEENPTFGWWAGFFSKRDPCAVVYTSMPGTDAARAGGLWGLKVISYRSDLLFGSSRLYVFRSRAQGCSAPERLAG